MTIQKFKQTIKKIDPDDEFMALSEICWTKEHQKKCNNEKAFYELNRYIDILPCKLNY